MSLRGGALKLDSARLSFNQAVGSATYAAVIGRDKADRLGFNIPLKFIHSGGLWLQFLAAHYEFWASRLSCFDCRLDLSMPKASWYWLLLMSETWSMAKNFRNRSTLESVSSNSLEISLTLAPSMKSSSTTPSASAPSKV